MVFTPAIFTAKAALVQEVFSQTIVNTLYFQFVNQPDEQSLQLLTSELATWWDTVLGPTMSVAVRLLRIEARDLTVQDGVTWTFTPTVNVTGDLPGDTLSNNVAFCLSFRTGFAGRSRRGRNYIAGLRTLDVVGNELSVNRSNALRDAYTQLIGLANINGWDWVVVSTVGNKQQRVQALKTPVTAVLYVDRVVDTQRRRLPGRGQ